MPKAVNCAEEVSLVCNVILVAYRGNVMPAQATSFRFLALN